MTDSVELRKICIVGAGAIGALLAVGLACVEEKNKQKYEVTVIARGPHLKAIQERGLTVRYEKKTLNARVHATSSITSLTKQHLIFIAVKAHQIEPIIKDLQSIMSEKSILVPLQNGIPWWYFQQNPHEAAKPYLNQIIRSVDPNGVLASSLPSKSVIGCIAFPAAYISEPGVIQHVEGDRFPIGELDGSTKTPRILELQKMITSAGFKSFILPDIRSEIWLKLWGNLSFNPISALTHGTLSGLLKFPLTRQLAHNMMAEAQTVAEKLGVKFRLPIQKRLDGGAELEHKSSMLQDVEAGRELEIDALVGAVYELAQLTNTPVPHIFSMYSSVKLLSHIITSQHVAFPPSKL